MKTPVSFLLAAIAALTLGSCVNQSGSVSRGAVLEMLESPHLAVTPFQPAWLNEGEFNPLLDDTRAKVCEILRSGEPRHVPELAYQTDDDRNELNDHRFYIYGSNAQCLAATVLGDRVAMHDVVLQPEQEKELYKLLKPYLDKVFSSAK